jgi:cob(I)alamin adenosyltransferase
MDRDKGNAVRERVKDGVCNQGEFTYRLTSTYKEGGGDSGLSNGVVGKAVSKNDPAYLIHAITEDLRLAISKVLLLDVLTEEERLVMEWIRNSTFSISSFCFCNGHSTRHLYPTNFLTYLESYIAKSKDEIGGAKDFIIWDSRESLLIDEMRVITRELERNFIAWSSSLEYKSSPSIKHMGAVINRLSSYFFWLNRSTYSYLGKKEIYWTGEMGSFPIGE